MMRKRKLGRSGLHATEISMGGSVPTLQSFGSGDFDREFSAALVKAHECGVNFFDNAEAYGAGKSEILLGRALGSVRDSIYIASKVSYENTERASIFRSCENSLRNLGTDRIDVFYLQFPNQAVPLEESIGAMMDLKRQGKIRAIGVCNFSLAQLKEACSYGEIDVLQTCYSLLWRKYVERELEPYCEKNSIGIVPFSPLASGLLSGKYRGDSIFQEGDQRARVGPAALLLYQAEWRAQALAVVDSLRPIAERYQKSLPQLAINWLAARPGVASVIFGARNSRQVEENIGSVGWEISEADTAAMDAMSRGFTDSLPNYLHYFLKMIGTNPVH